jgi:hypothetical protein
MNTYDVIRIADGVKVYEYRADAPIEWGGMEFANYNHVLVATDTASSPAPAGPAPVFGGNRHLTKLEFRKLLHAGEESNIDLIRAKFEDPSFTFNSISFTDAQRNQIRVIANKYNEATYIDLDDPDNKAGLTFFAQIGALESIDRVAEILNG